MMVISPSMLGADLLRLGEEIDLVERLGLTWLHLDNMDGHFVPNISYGPEFVAAMRRKTSLFLDVHLMLEYPRRYLKRYAEAGADMITVHAEAADEPADTLRAIAALGVKAGVALKPDTPPGAVEALLPLCDLVLVMTVEPGFGGQAMRADCIAKLPVLREMIRRTGRDIRLSVDGGINRRNARRVLEAGADVLVMGTGLFRADDPAGVVRDVRAAAEACACAR